MLRSLLPFQRSAATAPVLPAAIIAVIVLAFAAFGAIWYAMAVEGDREAAARQVRLIQAGVDAIPRTLAAQIHGARGSLDAASASRSAGAVSTRLIERLYRGHGHDVIVLAEPTGTVVQTLIDGEVSAPTMGAAVFNVVRPLLMVSADGGLGDGCGLRGDQKPAQQVRVEPKAGWVAIGDEFAAVAFESIRLDVGGTGQPRDLVLIAVRWLSPMLVSAHPVFSSVEQIRAVPPSANAFGTQVDLADPDGRPVGALVWTLPRGLLDAFAERAFVVVPLGVAVLAFVGFGLIVIRRQARAAAATATGPALADEVDRLTGALNRAGFIRAFERMLVDVARQPGRSLGVLAVDLSRFKDINEAMGHTAGDQVLKMVAQRMRAVVHPRDLIARSSGDEFLVLVDRQADREDLVRAAEAIIGAVSAPMAIDEEEVRVEVAIGLASAPGDGRDPEDLIRKADIALYKAKSEGAGRFAFFTVDMDEALRMRQMIRSELANAIKRNELLLLYQPQVSSDGQRLVGVEALIRWRHPERGMVSPGSFVPIAEETGLIDEIGRWVIRQACLDGRRWPGLTVAVNASPAQFRNGGFVQDVTRIVGETQMDPTRLEIEITEGVLMSNADTATLVLSGLRDYGFRLALDDFGTGYSSLSYLRKFPFGKLKIDRSFFQSVETDPQAAAVVQAIIGIAEALDMKVTAEGIETAGQHRFAQALGCHSIQGYYFSKPVSADEIDRWMSDGVPVPKAA